MEHKKCYLQKYLRRFETFHSEQKILPWQMKSTRIIKFSYLKMSCNAEFCVILSAFLSIVFPLLITTLLQNTSKWCNSKQCVVVKSQSVKGVQTTDGGVHYLTKGGSEMGIHLYYRLQKLKHKVLICCFSFSYTN